MSLPYLEQLLTCGLLYSGTKLSCGIHDCPQRCHQLFDHSKMSCPEIMQSKCLQGHKQSWKCGENPPKQCRKCEAEAIAREKRIQRDHELELKREAKQRQYRQQIEALDEEIELKRQMLRNQEMEDETALTLEKKKQDLENVKALAHRVASARMAAQNQAPPAKTLFQNYQQANFSANTPADGPSRPLDVSCPQQSPAKDEWEHQKRTENVNNEAIDSLMEMIGLEDLKGRFLNIKAKVDTVLRQNTDLKNERFGAALLGNPGTGKRSIL